MMVSFLLSKNVFLTIRLSLALIVVSVLAGCGAGGDAPTRRVVEGTVTFDSVPIHYGTIRFMPQPDGPVSIGIIKEGKYRVDNKGGVPVGGVKIQIQTEMDETQLTEDQILSAAPKPASPMVMIPEKYNTETTLEETIKSGSDSQKIDFSLTR